MRSAIFALMALSSTLLENAVDQLATLPGVGKRTAMRYALELLRREPEKVFRLAEALRALREKVQYCQECCNLSDAPTCATCRDPKRDAGLLCVVSDIRDVIAIENTRQYNGLYHVLGGVISPMDGIGPDDLTGAQLLGRLGRGTFREVVLALGATLEGDTTGFWLHRKIQQACTVHISIIARGISVGGELQYADEVTLGRSIVDRKPYEQGQKA
jgi:recombination protein RecR